MTQGITNQAKQPETINIFPIQEGPGRPPKIETLVEQSQAQALVLNASKKALSLIRGLPKMSDMELVANYVGVQNQSQLAFIMRGSIGYEAIKRAVERNGKLSKEKGMGADTVIKEVCLSIPGADPHTFLEDSRIFDNFGPYLLEQLEDDIEGVLPREFYVQACKVSKTDTAPMKMLEYFEDKRRATNGYYVGHARRDVAKVNAMKPLKDIDREDAVERAQAVQSRLVQKAGGGVNGAGANGPLGSAQSTHHPVDQTGAAPPTPKFSQFPAPMSEETTHYAGKMIAKSGSVWNYALMRAKEEFGPMNKKAPKKSAKK